MDECVISFTEDDAGVKLVDKEAAMRKAVEVARDIMADDVTGLNMSSINLDQQDLELSEAELILASLRALRDQVVIAGVSEP